MPTHGLRLLLVTAYAHFSSHALLQPTRQGLHHKVLHTSSPPSPPPSSSSRTVTPSRPRSALCVFFANENDKKPPPKNNINQAQNATSGSNADLFQTLQLKDEAIHQAQTAVSSLENALDSAVSNLESMQQQLRRKVKELEEELKTTRGELTATRGELDRVRSELAGAKVQLDNSNDARGGLEWALGQSQEEARKAGERVEQLEGYLADMGVDASSVVEKKRIENNPWQLWGSSLKSLTPVPVLDDWVIIKGSTEGEVQISGKVTNHPSIPDGDAIVTSPLSDASQAVEKKVVTTLSGSKYKLGSPMVMPAQKSPSKSFTQASSSQQLAASRASIALPALTGSTIGNGRYLLAGTATPSVNGRSFIQTAYRSSPLGKPTGEPLAIKVSQNKEAMKREFANYQKVAAGLKRGNFIKRVEFLPVAGQEMPDKSALVMQRGIADVKAFMPKVGGRLEGAMLYDCAMTALRCVEALHAAKLVWNDLKTENFVVIEDASGVSFRGIDLESCMPVRTNPVDYTPEACPPEFAQAFLDGEADTFLLEYSYDVWSYGMFLYEISTGRGFFDGLTAEKITKMLPTFEPDVQDVPDAQLADLISQCLKTNPKDRPSFVRISRHPYLANFSNKTPFDFLFGSSI
eukprot:CCRYP_004472-RA/>CCRYP_004472-RA protein AED:0.24 eAED:0.24 QI:146/1/1/1/1/1/2/473/632